FSRRRQSPPNRTREKLAGDFLPPGFLLLLAGPTTRFQAALDQAVGTPVVAVGGHGVGQRAAAEPVGRIAEHVAARIVDGAARPHGLAHLGLALLAVARVSLGVAAIRGIGATAGPRLIAAREGQRRAQGRERPPHCAPSSATSIAFSASDALAASGPPPCAMSGRPPPPLPPSAATPA